MGPTSTTFGTPAALSVLIFLAAGIFAFAMMVGVRAREAVRRRAARIGLGDDVENSGKRSLRYSGMRAAQALLEYTAKHYSTVDTKDMKVLRERLMRAGIYDPRAPAIFFLSRAGMAISTAAVAFVLLPSFGFEGKTSFWVLMLASGLLGYLAPSIIVDRMIAKRKFEHQMGFPDFMDLLVVCADAGLAMEASLDRVARELGEAYPSLSANVHMTNLELRAGRTLTDSLEQFGDRVGLEEARSFATLIQQSEELGSSIGDALRVYSDDMRHKRLSRAEEKAYALPAKLAVPMMVCIFPTLFVVILLPVIVRVATHNW